LPRHVAIIMDGNGRWAEQRGQARHAGHRAGVASVRAVIEESARLGLGALTLFAFSSENWRRPEKEVGLLMDLFMTALNREAKKLKANNISLRVIGDISAFPEKLQRKIRESERSTGDNDGLVLQIAANYGGRWDITQATRQLAEQVRQGLLQPEDIDESTLAGALSFPELPEPDLFIRTGGEQRISNFLLWQCAYTELYFTSTLWPDFDVEAYRDALREFAKRQRRFGMTGDQIGAVQTVSGG
jgi:undecaprenyl diphosphate synthase